MLALVVAMALTQNSVDLYDEGVRLGPVRRIDCVGAGIVCSLATTGSVVGLMTVSGGAGSGYATIKDEGTSLTQRTTVNFVGAITCVDNPGLTRTDCTVSGGSSNTGTFATTFGLGGVSTFDSQTSVVSAAWVGSSSDVLLTPKCRTTINNTVENCTVSRIVCSVVSISVGVSFTAVCTSPITASGDYTISYTGG